MRDIRAVARDLAEAHRRNDPRTQSIKFVRGEREDEIRLIEVSSDAPSIGEVLPVRFRADPAQGVDYPSIVVLLSPDEWERVQTGSLPLPGGWDLSTSEDI
jgi:hypothetical protein